MTTAPSPIDYHTDTLHKFALTGDIAAARGYFDWCFWANNPATASFQHLHTALLREDKPMMRLFVTYGAKFDAAQLRDLYDMDPERFDVRKKMLRSAGLALPLTADFNLIVAPRADLVEEVKRAFVRGRYIDSRLARLPEEWLNVCQAFEDVSKSKVMIAGGALRDLFNNRAIKDVDLFVPSQGSPRKNRKLIEAAFEKAGVALKQPLGKTALHVRDVNQHYYSFSSTSRLESWDVVAGPTDRAYNIIFVGGDYAKTLQKNPSEFTHWFDIGICQIATDGHTLFTSPQYRRHTEKKEIDLCQNNDGTPEHMMRIIAKYPDFTVTPYAKTVLDRITLRQPTPERR